MASFFILPVFFMFLVSVANPVENPPISHDLQVASEEMVKANYFTFVMLIRMSPPDSRIQGNVTFLMPNDRMLSRALIAEDSVVSFLLQHSIPSLLLFEHLEPIPSGSSIPTSEPNFVLDIQNNGRRSFFLNNVKIISPNICTSGSSIRCHGIDGVLTFSHSSPPCSNSSVPTIVAAPPPLPSPHLPVDYLAPSPPAQPSSSIYGSSQGFSSSFLVTSVIVSIVGFVSIESLVT